MFAFCRLSEYGRLLTVPSGYVLPDPITELKTGWCGEKDCMELWPPCMYADIASYLVDVTERALRERLLTDYKEGKAYSYFNSKWLREVFYHTISVDSQHCFVKAGCTPSKRVASAAHTAWICLVKENGEIQSAYCTCFPGFVFYPHLLCVCFMFCLHPWLQNIFVESFDKHQQFCFTVFCCWHAINPVFCSFVVCFIGD